MSEGQIVPLAALLGYCLFSWTGSKMAPWANGSEAHKVIIAFVTGIGITFGMIFPVYVAFSSLLFFRADFHTFATFFFIPCLLSLGILLMGWRTSKDQAKLRLLFKKIWLTSFYGVLTVYFLFIIRQIAFLVNADLPYYVAKEIFDKETMLFYFPVSIVLSIGGLWAFETFYFSLFEENVRGRFLTRWTFAGRKVFASMIGVMLIFSTVSFIDSQIHIFTPSVVEMEEVEGPKQFEDTILMDIDLDKSNHTTTRFTRQQQNLTKSIHP